MRSDYEIDRYGQTTATLMERWRLRAVAIVDGSRNGREDFELSSETGLAHGMVPQHDEQHVSATRVIRVA